MRNHLVERVWEANGLDCAVVLMDMGHRCGYVRVFESHPWHGLGYTDEAPNPQPLPEDATVDDYGMAGLIAALSGNVAERARRIEFQVRVHGGLTFAGPLSLLPDGWWFGFDCAHADDTPARWTTDAVSAEVERLSAQVVAAAQVAA